MVQDIDFTQHQATLPRGAIQATSGKQNDVICAATFNLNNYVLILMVH